MSKKLELRVVFESKDWQELGSFLEQHSYSQYFVLVDENTYEHCYPILNEKLEQLNVVSKLLRVPAGEKSKDIQVCADLWGDLTNAKADRSALLINLGGGMVTDLGGFVAATYKRGIDFLNIPTTLLAMVDASAGGKCGIDFHHYKNQIGVFQEAKRTIINPLFLRTLPLKELKSGYAEVIKHALIADENYFKQLQQLNKLTTQIDESILRSSVEVKERIVANDPFEKGERKKLNFGHTVGHAIESYFFEKNEAIPHGFAIAAGMVCESYLSREIIGLSGDEFHQIEALIKRNFELPSLQHKDLDTILGYIAQDKKNKGKHTQFTLLERIGSASINHKIDHEQIEESLRYYCDKL